MTINFELMLACDLRPVTPDQVIDTLKYLCRKEDYKFESLPNHPFFESDDEVLEAQRWRYIFDRGSYLGDFGGVSFTELYHHKSRRESFYTLTIRCVEQTLLDFIQLHFKFLEWLAPYVNTDYTNQEFIGYIRADNVDNTDPILIYFKDGVVYLSVTSKNLIQVSLENIEQFFYQNVL